MVLVRRRLGAEPGAGKRNCWLTGATITRKLGKRTTLGVELFHQGPDERGGTLSTLIGLGATHAVAERWSILGSAGSFTSHTAEHGRHRLYVALLYHG